MRLAPMRSYGSNMVATKRLITAKSQKHPNIRTFLASDSRIPPFFTHK